MTEALTGDDQGILGAKRLDGPEKSADRLRQVNLEGAAELKAETTRWFGQKVPPFEACHFRR
jgi:hypothetical protein